MTTVTNGTAEPHSLGDLPGQLDARRGGVGGEHPVAALGNVHRGAAGGPRSPQHPTGGYDGPTRSAWRGFPPGSRVNLSPSRPWTLNCANIKGLVCVDPPAPKTNNHLMDPEPRLEGSLSTDRRSRWCS